MKKPLKPLPTDCCGTGCRKCVYEIYEEQIAKYSEWKEKNGSDSTKEYSD